MLVVRGMNFVGRSAASQANACKRGRFPSLVESANLPKVIVMHVMSLRDYDHTHPNVSLHLL
jgi:hypothetical protein